MLSIGLCGFTIQAQADVIHSGDYIYELSGNPANATITGYTGPGGAIAIPSSLDGYPVVAIGDYAFFGVTNLTAVEIPDSVTSIGQYAFYGCTSLASLTISQQVASIGYVAFYHCSSLTTVAIPSNVTTIGIAAFAACDSLTAINVDAGNANYSSIDGVLYDKAVTTLIQCPAGKTGDFVIPDSVTTIGPTAFYYCVSITSVAIPDNVTTISRHAFYQCSSLTTVTIPTNVTSMGVAVFAACDSLTDIDVAASNTAFSSIDGVLYDKAVTTLIQCPAGKTGDFVIPDSVTTIGPTAFYYC
ncbi:MAG TPA: leucine-rich repeat domain-containing protein, partial [Methanomassiliicoccales archaeon]|nr:leucine-rich repeat domain-containing protein [Methanomassiliicoccales archaeon]